MMPVMSQSPATTGRINDNCVLRRNVQTQPYGRCTVCTLQLKQCHAWQSSGLSFALVVLLLALLLVPAGWPQTLVAGALLGVVVWQGMVNHRRTDELIGGQHRLLEMTQQLRGQQLVIEEHNSALAAQVHKRTAELREANVHLAEANLELLELDRRRQEMLSNVSHELRTPLTGILGAAQNLRDGLAGALTREQREYVELVQSDSERLIRVVGELLQAARAQSAPLLLRSAPVALGALAEEVCALLGPAAESKSVAIEVRGDARIEADADKLKQVLINLLDNAIKFSRPGSTVLLTIKHGSDGPRLAVEDDGPGIDPCDRSHLFERFYRGRSASDTAGSGLGLAIARNLARLHGGDIALDASRPRGSRFVLSLPNTSAVAT